MYQFFFWRVDTWRRSVSLKDNHWWIYSACGDCVVDGGWGNVESGVVSVVKREA